MQYLKINNKFDLLDYNNISLYTDKEELSDRYEITKIPQKILLYQAGYFTIKKITNNTALLTPANAEIEDSLLRLYLTSNNLKPKYEVKLKIDEIYKNIDEKDLLPIINIFNGILNDCVSSLSKIFQDERSVRDIIYATLPQELSLQKIKERESAKGFSDLELLTRKTHMVIEFKRTTPNRDAQTSLNEAIEQIKNKDYGKGAFQNLKLYRVAMVISTEKKSILPNFCKEII
ncbi:MAG: PD-(D/E)XK nuclease domain-containing protein [Desulfovibrionaceae bacterium]|nr:PD-(D/E)XK nuclease domain-containing protein [Desulfovibrionaceae bacterium]